MQQWVIIKLCNLFKVITLLILTPTSTGIKMIDMISNKWRGQAQIPKVYHIKLTFNPEDNSYIKCLSLPLTRVWFRYRARAIPKVKGNHKQSHSDLSCNLCTSKEEMSQRALRNLWGDRAREEGAWHGKLEGAAGLLEKNDEETWSYCDLGWSVNLGSCMIYQEIFVVFSVDLVDD